MTKQNILPYKLLKKNADTLTPVTIFKRLHGKKKFLLESSFQHEEKGKYSYIGANPYEEIIERNGQTTVINYETDTTETIQVDALSYIADHLPKLTTDLPLPFTGGAIGYTAYDIAREQYNFGEPLEDPLHMPDVHFMVYKDLIAYEHSTETAYLIATNLHDEGESQLDKRLKSLENILGEHVSIADPDTEPISFTPEIPKEAFVKKVAAAKEYIAAGEVSQVVLSQRMQANIGEDTFSIYRKLRTANPSPYMFYVDFADYLIIGASPESLVQTSGNNIVTNPIAGTRARGLTKDEDERLAKELLADKKETNEHEMLVELSKREIQPICEKDSLSVPTYMKIEKYEHVMHIVSEVHGTLKKDCTSMDALKACLPAGTVSGTPKKRAMEIINDLERHKRGFYGGGLGYITFKHDINIALAIRSLVIKDHTAYLQSGAGIVADSVPEKEYEETMQKAKSLIQLDK
ncbi:MAG TPA: anthranilate synthase component I [Bacillota bacterium]|nr:anthranilate synthase component I [Bacillota bacterium]